MMKRVNGRMNKYVQEGYNYGIDYCQQGKVADYIPELAKGKKEQLGICITDLEGNVVSWASAGTQGVKGSKKSTPFAAGNAAEAAGREAVASGMKKVKVEVKGLGAGREAAIRSLQTAGLEVESITDVTPIPHNGCRPPKRRRG